MLAIKMTWIVYNMNKRNGSFETQEMYIDAITFINDSLETCQSTQQQLQAFNDFSKARYQNINKHFETHTAMLKEMKRDMDSVFKKLRYESNEWSR